MSNKFEPIWKSVFTTVLFLQLSGGLTAQDVSDRVVVWVAQAHVKVDEVAVDSVVFGQVFEVRAIQGDWLWIRYRRSGWIAKSHVMPINQAVDKLNELIRMNPQNARYHHARGNVMGHLGRLEAAATDFSNAIRIDPNRAISYNNRGLAQQNLGKLDEAIADYDAALRLGVSNPIIYGNRAMAWRRKGQLQKAIEDFTEAIRIDPKFINGYSQRGTTFRKAGDFEKALKDYDQAITLDPKNAIDYNNRAWLRATCPDGKFRDGKQAVIDAKKACELTDWKVSRYVNTLAAAYAEAGNMVPAIRWLRKAMQNERDESIRATQEKLLASFRAGKPFRETIE